MSKQFLFTFFALIFVGFTALPLQASSTSSFTQNYVVVFKDNVDPTKVANEIALSHGLSLDNVYHSAIKGFSATIPASKINKIKADSRVAFISEDKELHVFGKPTNNLATQPLQSTPSGISRIGLNLSNKGDGVGIAVIDTGIDLSHPDLSGNIIANYSCIKGKRTGDDDNGHGTHVAGTIAALDNNIGVVGVAPRAKLLAVKVLSSSGSGSWSSVICGIDWVTANAAKYNIKVANMSLGGSGSSDNNCGNTNNDALHKAICKAKDAGITFSVAAGNDGVDASTSVPAAYDDAVITVSALADSDGKVGGIGSSTSYGPDDTFASFSNFGSVVDLGAPGVSVYSTYKGSSYSTLSGTSMATPHVSGAAALYIYSHPGSTWNQIRDGLKTYGETLNNGHTDTSGLHPEPIVKANSLQ